MRKIAVLDTWVGDTNLGNRIVMAGVETGLRRLFPHDFHYHAPALEHIRASRGIVQSADLVFLAGTNLLSADMATTSEWRIGLRDARWLRRVVLLGVGWWQYQSRPVDARTRLLLRTVLDREAVHSTRDSYTARRLEALRHRATNTGCPTLWDLDDAHCATIPQAKADAVLLTFTEYHQDERSDAFLWEVLARNYRRIYFWPQQFGDLDYVRAIGGDPIVVDPSLEALDDALADADVDYVGTRLHAGIRALQHGRRSLIVGVDNRAIEMARDFHLPVLARDTLAAELESRIAGEWATAVRVDYEAIDRWAAQFGASWQSAPAA